MQIFDTHAHYNTDMFDEDREAVLASLPSCGVVGVVNVGASLEDVRDTRAKFQALIEAQEKRSEAESAANEA